MESRLADLLSVIEEIAKIGSYETDLTTGNWRGSDNFIKIFGLEKKEEYTVYEFQAIVHPDDLDRVMAYFVECLEKQIDFNYEYRCLTRKGDVIYVSSRSKISYDSFGRPLTIHGVKQDITDLKRNEMRLLNLNENNRKKNEVLSVVAHDLKSPIQQLQGLAAIMKCSVDKDHHDLLTMQEEICNSAKAVIAELIEIAELEDDVYTPIKIKTDMNKLIMQCIKHFEQDARKKNISIKTLFAKRCFAAVNPEKFSRAIENLISNALKFTPENKIVELTTRVSKTSLFIEVADQGIGIEKNDIPFLFEKFSKTIRRRGTNGEQSSGLGLSIVRQIIDLHNGTITVNSQKNIGTTFTIELSK
jgi:PAS domain S-box-containing protein